MKQRFSSGRISYDWLASNQHLFWKEWWALRHLFKACVVQAACVGHIPCILRAPLTSGRSWPAGQSLKTYVLFMCKHGIPLNLLSLWGQGPGTIHHVQRGTCIMCMRGNAAPAFVCVHWRRNACEGMEGAFLCFWVKTYQKVTLRLC